MPEIAAQTHTTDEKPVRFEHVLTEELAQIDARRDGLGLGTPLAAEAAPALEQARDRRLIGLSFSGGGIRSATFNLGVLQGLAHLDLLKVVDYLSTVSGGGYIGGWVAAWVKRGGKMETVAKKLPTVRRAPAAEAEAEPVRHLRRYSNYLAPRQGFLSADTWVLWASYLRNFLLNQLVLLPAVVAVLLLSRLLMLAYHPLLGEAALPRDCFTAILLAFAALLLVAFFTSVWSAGLVCSANNSGNARTWPPLRPLGMLLFIVLELVAAAVLFCTLAPYELPFEGVAESWSKEHPTVGRVASFGTACAALAGIAYLVTVVGQWRAYLSRPLQTLGSVAGAMVAGLLGGALLYGDYELLHGLYADNNLQAADYVRARAAARVTTFGPPLVLGTAVLGIFVAVCLAGRWLREELREWWSSLCGRLLMAALVWLSVNLVALYGTAVVLWAGPWVQAALASGWLATVWAGLVAGRSPRTRATESSKGALEWLAWLAPHIFVAGLLVGVSVLLHLFLDSPPRWQEASATVWPHRRDPERPPTRVTTTQTRQLDGGKPTFHRELSEQQQYLDVPDEMAILGQTYWLGILNTKPGFVPREQYKLRGDYVSHLQALGVPRDVVDRLHPLEEEDGVSRAAFVDRLDKLVPRTLAPAQRRLIIRYAKSVSGLEFDPQRLGGKLGGWLAVCVVLLIGAAWFVDVNKFSLHGVYGNRLVRAYLGASRPYNAKERSLSPSAAADERQPDPVTEFDPNDDLKLTALQVKADSYDGPYLIVNTALNLVHGDRLDWQERKAESFILTPLYCGSEDTGFRPTAEYAGPEGVSLGTAITISGAAASPNMGYHSSPAVTALLTVFNARLGAWLGNPASPTHWRSCGPRFGFVHLFRELFGWTQAEGRYVYLSDGGHFENLGAYELIRRRCQYVIVSDAGQDPGHIFEDLGNLIHKCRTDFGIEIEIDLDAVRHGATNRCRWHCAIGRIRYDLIDRKAVAGTLVYLKPSLTGDEPADVLHYADSHPDFPHHTTADQFFDESALESYRALGEHVVRAVFTQSVGDVEDAERKHKSGPGGPPGGTHVSDADPQAERHHRRCRELFASLVRRWFAMPPDFEPTFIEATHGYLDLQEAFRRDGRLWRLTLGIYPELDPAGEASARAEAEERGKAGETDARIRAEVHVIAQMLQVMENAWLSLKLDVNYAHPLNRGWMDIFHRWTSARPVREYWSLLRAEFGRGFVSFCEQQMRMGEVEARAALLALDADKVPSLLADEFRAQWPAALPGLEGRLQEARERNGKGWLIFSKGAADPLLDRTPCGIILVTPDQPTVGGPYNGTACELFVWLRGAYRNSGLGRDSLATVLNQLRKDWRGVFTLYVRLPVRELTGPGGELQKRMWMTFFYHFDFVPSELPPAARGQPDSEEVEVRLERRFPVVDTNNGSGGPSQTAS